VAAIVNYDRFSIAPELIDDYTAMVKGIMDRYYTDVTRYTSSTFLRARLGESFGKRVADPQIFGSRDEAQQRLKSAAADAPAAPSGAALDFLDEALHAGGDVAGIAFVGIDVHGQAVVGIDAHHDVAVGHFALALDAHAHHVAIAQAQAHGILGRHVDMALGTDHATLELRATGRTFEADARACWQGRRTRVSAAARPA
jgi:hypothetical protein